MNTVRIHMQQQNGNPGTDLGTARPFLTGVTNTEVVRRRHAELVMLSLNV